ncbi:MAG: NAD(P)H-hydrate dehydratase [Bacteroidota bacterium]
MLLANTQQIRLADAIQIEEYQYPGILLMEKAGMLAAERICEEYGIHQPFLCLIGPGNNGGDVWVIARELHLKGYNVLGLCSHPRDRYKGDAQVMFQVAEKVGVKWQVYEREEVDEWIENQAISPILIDGLLGTGVQQEVRGLIKDMLSFFREKALPTIAIDLPSGLNAHSGRIQNEVLPAEKTYTFQLPKVCHQVTPASIACGKVEVLDIGIFPQVIDKLGIRRETLDNAWFKENFQRRRSDSHKGSMGHSLLIGGSKAMGGALVLSALGAKHSGVGLCTCMSVEVNRQLVLSQIPEVMFAGVGEDEDLGPEHLEQILPFLEKKKAVCIGPGMGDVKATADLLKLLLPHIKVPLVLDAGALSALAAYQELWALLPEHTVLTPHPGEMRGLMPGEDVINERLEVTEKLSTEKKCTVVLKGQGSIIAGGEKTYINTTGNAGMASGGTGDVLTGMIGSFLAQGYEAEKAAALACFLHGAAGDFVAKEDHENGLLASILSKSIGPTILSLLEN